MRYVIFRGRFQPFTRVHYNCIRTFFNDHLSLDESTAANWPWLILCIVRDYETLGSEHSLLSSNTDPLTKFLRHHFIFNPLSILQCEKLIRDGLHNFLEKSKKEEGADVLGGFERFISTRILIQAVPIKFLNLIQALKMETGDSGRDQDIKKVATYFAEKDSTGALIEDRAAINLTRLLFYLSKELVSMGDPDVEEPLSRQWLIPIFDKEELDDINALLALGEIAVSPDPYSFISEETSQFAPELPALNSGPQIRDKCCKFSPIGTFIYYTYLLWIRAAYVTEQPAYYYASESDIQKDIRNVESFLGRLLSPDPDAIRRYKHIVFYKLRSAVARARSKALTPGEYVILFHPDKFFSLAKECLAVPEKEAADDISDPLGNGNNMYPTISLKKQVFICYNQDDTVWRNKFAQYLSPYEMQGQLKVCHDGLIPPQTKWEEWIERAVAESKVVLALVTTAWMGSEYISKKEWPLIREAFKQKQLTIRWVHVTRAPYELHDEFKWYQAAYDPAMPFDRLAESDLQDALHAICGEIAKTVNA